MSDLCSSVVDHVLAGGRELAVALDDLVDGVEQVLLADALPASSDGEHAGLGAHTADVSTSRVRAEASDQFKADVLVECHRLGVDLEDLHAALQLWQAELNLAIKTTGSGESRVESVRSVGSHEHLHVATGIETIKLIDDLKHSPLNFRVAFTLTCSADGINFIKEKDARLLGACESENLSDHASTLTDVPLHELRTNDSDEASISAIGNSSRSEGLASAWWAIQENTLGWVDAKGHEPLRVQQRHLNHFSYLVNLVLAATKVVVADIRLLFNGHHSDCGVNLGRQRQLD